MAEYMVITVNIGNGRIEKVEDEKGEPAKIVTDKDLPVDGEFKYLGAILYSHSSPGCITLYSPGRSYKLC